MLGRRRNIHYLFTAIAVLSLIPALKFARLPMRWDWPTLIAGYATIAVQSAMAAVLLHAVQFPAGSVKFLRRLPCDLPKLLLTILYAAGLVIMTTATKAILAVILTIAIMGLLNTEREKHLDLVRLVSALIPSASYLFFGLFLVFTFVNIIVRIRFYGLYSVFFDNIDETLIGPSLSILAQHLSRLKGVLYPALDFVYYGMFAQIGAALVICSVSSGARRSLQLVGTILFSYYIALILFFSIPSIGPFLHAGHFSAALQQVSSYKTQRLLLANAQYLWEQRPVSIIPTGYYIGFPCMHIAQPVVVLSYLRKWKRMAAVLLAYDLLLVVAILMVEWHYLADIIGGVTVAAAALFVIGTGPEGASGKGTVVGDE
jgi:hypothetical protein